MATDKEFLLELSADISDATDTLKYLMRAGENVEPEALEGLKAIKGACEDYILAFDYYFKE